MTVWIGSISYEQRANWDICRQRGLFGSGNFRSRKMEAGDELFVWGARQGWLAHCVALDDARIPLSLEEVPWPEPAKYKAVVPIRIVAEPGSPISMRKPELAELGLETMDLRQFPPLDEETAQSLRDLFVRGVQPSPTEDALADALRRRGTPLGSHRRMFGELPGVPVGTWWPSRLELARSGAHRPNQAGISGTRAEGSESVVVNGGYEDDLDQGDEIIYTGAGGNDSASGRQIADQSLEQPGNAGLVTAQNRGLPVRVVRGFRGDPTFSPNTGYRYDGLFRVADHWSAIGRSGFRVWQFRLVVLDPTEARPYRLEQDVPVGNRSPGASQGITTRVARDTSVSRYVKGLHGDACQVCSVQLSVPGGTLSEGAHIRALGGPHSGPDTTDNVLCLCPNHHSLFDQGGIYITDEWMVVDHDGTQIGRLRQHPRHAIDLENVRAHRRRWGLST